MLATPREAAQTLNVSRETVYRMAAAGQLPTVRVRGLDPRSGAGARAHLCRRRAEARCMSTPGIEQLVGERFKLKDSCELEAVSRLLDVAHELYALGLIEADDSWCRTCEPILERIEEGEPA